MPRDYDSDKPKRSWRDIDRQKDKSAHRDPDRPKMNPFKQARADSASKVYKSKLGAFFDGDAEAPEHVRQKLSEIDETSAEGKARTKALKAIKDAATSSALDKAFGAYLGKWEMPPDYDILSQALNCGDETFVAEALELIEAMLADNRVPKRLQLLEQRLRRVKTLADDPDLQDKAGSLLKTLRLFS
jgi:hypothetical protein